MKRDLFRRRLLLLAGVCVLGSVLVAQTPPALSSVVPRAPAGQLPADPTRQAPVFRAGVDLVQVDVSVLDDQRRPVHGLTAADFTVLEDGIKQPISAFVERSARDPDPSTAAWTRTVPPDVRANNAEDGRLLLLVLDDASTPVFASGRRGYAPTGPDPRLAVQNAARAVVDRMGPADLAAIIFTVKNKNEQEFTSDRTRLMAAIDGFRSPGEDVGGANLDLAASTFREAARVLATVPNRRKALIHIGARELVSIALDTYPDLSFGHSEKLLQDSMRWAMRSNVTFYHINPFQMTELDPAREGAPGSAVEFRPPTNQAVDPEHQAAPITLASGGFTIRRPGELASGIAQIFSDIGSYYLLGYAKPARKYTDKLRKIDVRVSRSDVTLHARSGYFDEKPIVQGPSSSPLHTAIAGLLPANDIAMRVNIAPFAIPGKKEAALMIVVGLRQPITGAADVAIKEVVSRLTQAYTPEGDRKQGVSEVISLDLRSTTSEVKYELLTRLDLKPGRYHVRLSATSRAFGKSGSVYEDLEVPDFWKLPVSLSGVVLSAEPPLTSGPFSILNGVLPAAPTTQREFAGHRASAFLRVYQGGSDVLAPVTLETGIHDTTDAVVHRTTMTLGLDRFGTTDARAADVRYDLPLKDLAPGGYLLTFDATRGSASARRDVRFWVR